MKKFPLALTLAILLWLVILGGLAEVCTQRYASAPSTEEGFLEWCQGRIEQVSSIEDQAGRDAEMMTLLGVILTRQEIACRNNNAASPACQEARQCLALAQQVWGATGSHGKEHR